MATLLAGSGGQRSTGPLRCLVWRHGSTIWQPALLPLRAAARLPELPKGGSASVIDSEARNHWELPIDLEWVATVLEGDPMRSQGAFLDLKTGDVIPAFMTELDASDGEPASNPAAEPDRWLFLPSLGSRAVRQDMAEFAAMIKYRPMRRRIEEAIEGLGAFHRFRDLIYAEGLVSDWQAFSDGRRIARAREFLAELGVRVSS
jgi:hypothetical protein